MRSAWSLPPNTGVSTTYYLTDQKTHVRHHKLQQNAANVTKDSFNENTAFDKIEVVRASDKVKQLTLNMDYTRKLCTPTGYDYVSSGTFGFDNPCDEGNSLIFFGSGVSKGLPNGWKIKVVKASNQAIMHFKNMPPLAQGKVQRFQLDIGQLTNAEPARILGIHEISAAGEALDPRAALDLHGLDMRLEYFRNNKINNEHSEVVVDGGQPALPKASWCCGIL